MRAFIVSWFKVSDGRVRFRGRITRKPVADWMATPDGSAVVDALAAQLGFCLLGKKRTARRHLWRELETAATSASVNAIIQASPDHYVNALTELAYAPALPRVVIALRRLVVIPRTMIAARGRSALNARLMTCSLYADMTRRCVRSSATGSCGRSTTRSGAPTPRRGGP